MRSPSTPPNLASYSGSTSFLTSCSGANRRIPLAARPTAAVTGSEAHGAKARATRCAVVPRLCARRTPPSGGHSTHPLQLHRTRQRRIFGGATRRSAVAATRQRGGAAKGRGGGRYRRSGVVEGEQDELLQVLPFVFEGPHRASSARGGAVAARRPQLRTARVSTGPLAPDTADATAACRRYCGRTARNNVPRDPPSGVDC